MGLESEQKLNVTRETTLKLQGQLETQKSGYEEQIGQLEAQIMEMFKMLKEMGKGVDHILDAGSMDRKTLVQTLEKHFQRSKTINILEGREARQKNTSNGADADEERDGANMTPNKASLRRGSKAGKKRSTKNAKASKVVVDENGRVSQFMDADEADAQEQIQQQLAAGVKVVSEVLLN
jgi:cytokinesis protein